MNANSRLKRAARLIGAMIILVVLAGRQGQAQDDFESVQPAAPQPGVRDQGFRFEWCAYGNGNDAPKARIRLEAQLGLYLDRIDRVCSLSAAQREKLDLVGRLEIKRHFAEIDLLQRHYQAVKQAASAGPPDFERYKPIISAVAKLPLAGDQGSFDYSMTFYKICKTTLRPEQFAVYRAERRAARESAHRVMVQRVVGLLDSRAALTHDQRTKLTDLLWDAMRNSRRMGASEADFMLTAAQAGLIPAAKIKPLVSAEQWQRVGPLLSLLTVIANAEWQTLGSLPPDPDLDLPPPVANRAKP